VDEEWQNEDNLGDWDGEDFDLDGIDWDSAIFDEDDLGEPTIGQQVSQGNPFNDDEEWTNHL
jgi:twitching motility protein PilJ